MTLTLDTHGPRAMALTCPMPSRFLLLRPQAQGARPGAPRLPRPPLEGSSSGRAHLPLRGSRPSLRRRRGPLPARAGESGGGDAGESLGEQLHEQRLDVSEAPAAVQAPAAVGLPHASAAEGPAQPAAHGPWPWLALLRLARWLRRAPSHALNWLIFQTQQRIILGTLRTKLLSFFLVGAPVVAAGALAYTAVSGKPLREGLNQAYGLLYKVPGPAQVLGDVNLTTVLLNNGGPGVGGGLRSGPAMIEGQLRYATLRS